LRSKLANSFLGFDRQLFIMLTQKGRMTDNAIRDYFRRSFLAAHTVFTFRWRHHRYNQSLLAIANRDLSVGCLPLWNQLPSSFRYPNDPVHSPPGSPHRMQSLSLYCQIYQFSAFYSSLTTHLFNKFFPPYSLSCFVWTAFTDFDADRTSHGHWRLFIFFFCIIF